MLKLKIIKIIFNYTVATHYGKTKLAWMIKNYPQSLSTGPVKYVKPFLHKLSNLIKQPLFKYNFVHILFKCSLFILKLPLIKAKSKKLA